MRVIERKRDCKRQAAARKTHRQTNKENEVIRLKGQEKKKKKKKE
jgi:hypothetical protein